MTDQKEKAEKRERIAYSLSEDFWKEYKVLSEKLLEAEEKKLPQEMKKITAKMQELLLKYQ